MASTNSCSPNTISQWFPGKEKPEALLTVMNVNVQVIDLEITLKWCQMGWILNLAAATAILMGSPPDETRDAWSFL